MAQEIRNAFVEMVERLTTSADSTGTGDYGLLEGVHLVEGPTEETFNQSQLPVVVYEILDGGFAEDACFPKGARSKFTVLLTVMTDVSKGYTSVDELGIIDLYEKIMTVLDQNTSKVTDLTGAGAWGPIPPQYKVGGFERSGMINTYLIEVEFQTVRYERGSLRS